MIIYYDSGGKLFGNIIRENGQGWHYPPLVPGEFGMFLCKIRAIKQWVCRLPKVADDDPLLIVFDTYLNLQYIVRLKKKYPDKQIVCWCWNPINKKNKEAFRQIGNVVPVWSYSPADCKRYGMKYNTQFFFDSLIPDHAPGADEPKASGSAPKALFIGREKSKRAEMLERIFSELEASGAVVEKHLVKKLDRHGILKYVTRENLIPYRDVLKMTADADILIDCYGSDTAGCSLRPLESMFFGKKLVTDNPSLMEYDFYDSHNIYVFGHEDRSLKEFMEEPFVPVPDEIKNEYRFSRWLQRFLESDQP